MQSLSGSGSVLSGRGGSLHNMLRLLLVDLSTASCLVSAGVQGRPAGRAGGGDQAVAPRRRLRPRQVPRREYQESGTADTTDDSTSAVSRHIHYKTPFSLRYHLADTVACSPQEVALLKGLSYDRNIVQFYGVCPQPGGEPPLLVLEYMAGVTLQPSSAEGPHLNIHTAARRQAAAAGPGVLAGVAFRPSTLLRMVAEAAVTAADLQCLGCVNDSSCSTWCSLRLHQAASAACLVSERSSAGCCVVRTILHLPVPAGPLLHNLPDDCMDLATKKRLAPCRLQAGTCAARCRPAPPWGGTTWATASRWTWPALSTTCTPTRYHR
jgi:hypothetical protein